MWWRQQWRQEFRCRMAKIWSRQGVSAALVCNNSYPQHLSQGRSCRLDLLWPLAAAVRHHNDLAAVQCHPDSTGQYNLGLAVKSVPQFNGSKLCRDAIGRNNFVTRTAVRNFNSHFKRNLDISRAQGMLSSRAFLGRCCAASRFAGLESRTFSGHSLCT